MENVICYGIGECLGSDCIEIESCCEGVELCIEVCNCNSVLELGDLLLLGYGIGLLNIVFCLCELYGDLVEVCLDMFWL